MFLGIAPSSAEAKPATQAPPPVFAAPPPSVVAAPPSPVVAAPPSPVPEQRPPTAPGAGILRVSAGAVDALMGLSADLVSNNQAVALSARLASDVAAGLQRIAARGEGSQELARLAEVSRRLDELLTQHDARSTQSVARLEERVRKIAMVPVDTLASFLRRIVAEACRSTGKRARLEVSGGDVEIDRAILTKLQDPLMHLVRNSVAHGIEADRRSAGKPEQALITIEAVAEGTRANIRLSDDGAGIRPDEVLRRAVRSGLVSRDVAADLSDTEAVQLIFESGLSTAEGVTGLAGRGVGLDVVRRCVRELGGSVSVQSSPGIGTTFVLSIPATRMTTRGVVVQLSGQRFIVPSRALERVLAVDDGVVMDVGGAEVVKIGEDLVPAASLGRLLDLPASAASERTALLLNEGGRRRAFLVDEVLGDQDYILQPLAWNLDGLQHVMGYAVLDGGDVVLALGPGELLDSEASGRLRSKAAVEEKRLHRILVVDDSVTSRTLLKNILSFAEYDVSVAVDGMEALECLQEVEFDLVVSDVEMPRLDGIGLLRAIRDQPELRHLPVLLVTSKGKEEHRRAGYEAGADAYIVKGVFDQRELLEAVARLL